MPASSEGLSGKQAPLLFCAPAAISLDGPKQQVRTRAKMSYGFFKSKYLCVQKCTWASWSKGNPHASSTMPVSGDLASKAMPQPSLSWEERFQLLTAAKHQLLFEVRQEQLPASPGKKS